MADKPGTWSGGQSANLGPTAKALELAARISKGDAPSGVSVPVLAKDQGPKTKDPDHTDTYRAALHVSSTVYTVVSLAENERYYLRDQLERKSTLVPQLVTKALSAIHKARVDYYRSARDAARDCLTLLDVLRDRGTVELEAVEPARAACLAVMARLDDLTRLR